jgi:hypothetical protein
VLSGNQFTTKFQAISKCLSVSVGPDFTIPCQDTFIGALKNQKPKSPLFLKVGMALLNFIGAINLIFPLKQLAGFVL